MNKDVAIETATAILAEHYEDLTPEMLVTKISGTSSKTYSSSEFAEAVGYSKATVHRWLNEGIIKGRKNALGKIRISESEIAKILG